MLIAIQIIVLLREVMSSLTFVISAVLTLFLLQSTDDIRLLSAKALETEPSKEVTVGRFGVSRPNVDLLPVDGANTRADIGDVRSTLVVKTAVGSI